MDKIDTRIVIVPVEPGTWYAVPYLLSDGTRDWRVCVDGDDGNIKLALNRPSRRKAEALADRLNRAVAWYEVREG